MAVLNKLQHFNERYHIMKLQCVSTCEPLPTELSKC